MQLQWISVKGQNNCLYYKIIIHTIIFAAVCAPSMKLVMMRNYRFTFQHPVQYIHKAYMHIIMYLQTCENKKYSVM